MDPDARTMEWLVCGARGFAPADGSAVLDISGEERAAAIDWPT